MTSRKKKDVLTRGEVQKFRKTVLKHHKESGRHTLPWRKTYDAYQTLVSEVMLQQTQVDRVIPFYKDFVKQFGTAKKLAEAPLSRVLKSWQGLGYNRRAKQLHAAAKELVKEYKGILPTTVEELEELPGIGPYTARAVAAFAHNRDAIVVETNIRTAIVHHFFKEKKKVADAEIERILAEVLPKGRAREWYSALMDYGAALKRAGISHNARIKGYIRQARFEGSPRQARGAILRALTKRSQSRAALIQLLGPDRAEQLASALVDLEKEGLVEKKNLLYHLAT